MRETNRKEIRRYLGIASGHADAHTEAEIDDALDQLNRFCRPAYIREYYDLRVSDHMVSFAGLSVTSRNLSANLSGCRKVCVMACTLGSEADRLIRRASVASSLKEAVYQASASAMAEAWCETVNDRIREEAEAEGLFCRPRFSPGYGDLPLSVQKDIFRILPVTKEIGVTLTDSLLMVPVKSITAFIGLSEDECRPAGRKCDSCSMREECAYSLKGEKS